MKVRMHASRLGFGHVMRCVALAEMLDARGHELTKGEADWVVIDAYDADEYESAVTGRLLVIDDLNRDHFADIVLSPTLYKGLTTGLVFNGCEYVPLRRSVLDARAKAKVRSGDSCYVAYPYDTAIVDGDVIVERILAADYAIGAGGVSAWERVALGLPTVIRATDDSQHSNVAAIIEAGAGWPDGPHDIFEASIACFDLQVGTRVADVIDCMEDML